jgi:hypothetical protein
MVAVTGLPISVVTDTTDFVFKCFPVKKKLSLPFLSSDIIS